MFDKLQKIGLNPKNSIVIGSGILQALGLGNSNDIDVVVEEIIFNILKLSNNFEFAEYKGKKILKNNVFEIGTGWDVLGKSYKFNDLLSDTVVIGNVRYVSLYFLYKVKKSWVAKDTKPRLKDIQDVKLIEDYLITVNK